MSTPNLDNSNSPSVDFDNVMSSTPLEEPVKTTTEVIMDEHFGDEEMDIVAQSQEISVDMKEDEATKNWFEIVQNPITVADEKDETMSQENSVFETSPSPDVYSVQSQIFGVKKLDNNTSSTIRQSQIITKISDVVRELVENSVDAKATQIQIHLDNYGLNKIEVKDNGSGFSISDLVNVIKGGHTSKLEDTKHTSCQNYYGFRGEALAAICSLAKVSITTRTEIDQKATKYILDKKGQIVSQSNAAYEVGTIVTVENLFENFPVRRKFIGEKKRCVTELKNIENFIKCEVAIPNPQINFSLNHNGSRIWYRGTVLNIDQSIVTVLGHQLTKGLEKCGPRNIDLDFAVDGEGEDRTITAFFLKNPIDMKTMSFTSNKMTLVYINRKQVVIREFEKLIQQYTFGAVDKPSPADRRRFPITVIIINVPISEVDFNREMDKSKVFLVCKDAISRKLEEMLQTFYEITVEEINEKEDKVFRRNSSSDKVPSESDMPVPTNECGSFYPNKSPMKVIPIDKENRKMNIQSFLENIPTASANNFSSSPIKSTTDEGTVHFATGRTPQSGLTVPFDSKNPVAATDTEGLRDVPSHTSNSNNMISNFELELNDILMDTPPGENIPDSDFFKSSSSKENGSGVIDINQWIRGQIPDKYGIPMQNVNIVNTPVTATLNNESRRMSAEYEGIDFSHATKPSDTQGDARNAFNLIGSGFQQTQQPPRKKPRLSKNNDENAVSLNSTPRQITLDRYKSWGANLNQSHNSQQSFSSQAPTGDRQPFKSSVPARQRHSSNNSVRISLGSTPTRNEKRRSSLNDDVELENEGLLIGKFSDPNFYTAKINNFLGIFHPMNMLQEFPSLKYDLNIPLVKMSSNEDELDAKYVVDKKFVPLLFTEFVRQVNSTCDNYPKIFHRLKDMSDQTNIQGNWLLTGSSTLP